jgi:hypothetical protein
MEMVLAGDRVYTVAVGAGELSAVLQGEEELFVAAGGLLSLLLLPLLLPLLPLLLLF